MAWYKTGTVSATNGSATVTGVGTDFVANAQVGEEFRLAGGQRGYEITAINSNTSLTISPAYMDSTQSGASYVIVPTRGFANEARDALRSILTTLDGYLDGPLSGLFGSGTVGAPGLASKTDTNTGFYWPSSDQIAAATNGIQRMLLSAAALQVDVPITGTAVQQSKIDATDGRVMKVGAFGLGQTGGGLSLGDWNAVDKPAGMYLFSSSTANLASKPSLYVDGNYGYVRIERYNADNFTQTCWRAAGDMSPYTRRYINGTWTDWVPTGPVLAEGSGPNGHFLALSNGKQICWNWKTEAAHAVTTAQGALYRSDVSITAPSFPAAFAAPPAVIPRGGFAANLDGWLIINGAPTTTAVSGGSLRVMAAQSRTEDVRWGYLAIGDWM